MSIVKSGSAVYKPLGKKGKGGAFLHKPVLYRTSLMVLTRGLKMEREPTPRN